MFPERPAQIAEHFHQRVHKQRQNLDPREEILEEIEILLQKITEGYWDDDQDKGSENQ